MKSNLLNTQSKIINCIVTGFDPFGDISANPSQLIVEKLPESIETPSASVIEFSKLILPTCCSESWKILRKVLDQRKEESIVLIMLGLADERKLVTMERVALNLRDYRIEDNLGHKHPYGKIDDNLENAFFNDLNLDFINEKLNKGGFLTDVSYHAGTFVCNELYFQSLKYQKDNSHLRSSLFVHVPNLADRKEEDQSNIFKTKDEQLHHMKKTILAIIKEQAALS